jgi:hypothetical protein
MSKQIVLLEIITEELLISVELYSDIIQIFIIFYLA